jgi:rare lipoprotein A
MTKPFSLSICDSDLRPPRNFLRAGGNDLKPQLFDRAGGRDRRGDRRAVITDEQLEDDAMKWTLMVTTCLLAFAISPPASARHSHKDSSEKLHAQAHLGHVRGHEGVRTQGRQAPASKHIASSRGGLRSHRIAAIGQRPATGEHARGERVDAVRHHHASSSFRHGRFAAVRNKSALEARGAGAEGGSVGMASFYSASGMTAAHRSLPFGTRVRVTNLSNGSSVVVRINDRGPFTRGRSIDLSTSAARALRMTGAGVARVRMHVI